jgi:hypothetical protein
MPLGWNPELFDAEALKQRGQDLGLETFDWGARGPETVQRIEAELGVPFGPQLRAFALGVGNLCLGSATITVTGNAGKPRETSCLNETFALRKILPHMPADWIVLRYDSGTIYCSFAGQDAVRSYDRRDPAPWREIDAWEDLTAFIGWLFEWEKSTEPDEEEDW